MKGFFYFLMLSCIAFILQQCARRPASLAEIEPVSFLNGQLSGIESSKNILVTNERDWEQLWIKMHANEIPVPPVPPIQFSDSFIIATFQGNRSTGGYSSRIYRMENKSGFLDVYIRETVPGKNCMVTMGITQPYDMVMVPVQKFRQIKFHTEQEISECE